MDVKTNTREVRQGSVGWMMKRLSSRLDAQMNARLRPHGLDLSSFAVLMTILEHNPIGQVGVAAQIQIPAYQVSRSVDQLEKLGFVERLPDPHSRRSVILRPTEAGRSLAPVLYGIVKRVNAQLLGPLSEAERDQMVDMLQRMLLAERAWTTED